MVGLNFDSATTQLATNKISEAEAEINKYLSKRYDLSSSTFQTAANVPPLVQSLCSRLAEGYMWCSNSRGSKESLTRGKQLIDDVLTNLKQIQDYKADLTSSTGVKISEVTNTAYLVKSNTTDYVNTFDEGDELAWQVDPNKLEDISGAKT